MPPVTNHRDDEAGGRRQTNEKSVLRQPQVLLKTRHPWWERESRKIGSTRKQRCRPAVLHGWGSAGFLRLEPLITNATRLSVVVCLPLRAWLEPLCGAELNANRATAQCLPLHGKIYHLPPYDVGSERQWDKQCVRRCSGLMLGVCKPVVMLLTAWSCFPSWGIEFP